MATTYTVIVDKTMDKKTILSILFICLSIFGFTFTSCIDDEYDLGNKLDKTISLGGANLTFPLGSVDSIKLNKIIKKNELTVSRLHEGEYSILRKNQQESFNILVPTTSPINITPTKIANIALCPRKVYPVGDVNILPVNGSYDINYKTLPQEIRALKALSFSKITPVKMTVKLAVTGLTSSAILRLKDVKITFPKFIVSPDLDAKNQLSIKNERLSTSIIKNINVTSFDFSREAEGVLPIRYQSLVVSKDVSLSGMITCTNMSASTASLASKIDVEIATSSAIIDEVEGNIAPAIRMNIQPIAFTVPDFLRDDDIIMDAQDPLVRLNVSNDLDLPIIIKGTLQGYRDGKVLNQVTVAGKSNSPIFADGAGQTTLCFSRTGLSGENGTKKYQIADLNNLIVRIPDQIRFSVDASADQRATYKVQLGKKYKIKVASEVEVPLKFGPGLSIVYNDTIDHFNKQIKGLAATRINISVNVLNSIPLVLKLEAFPIGVDKSLGILKGINVTVNGTINSCNKAGDALESAITIGLAETTVGALKQLDGLLFKVTAISTETIYGMPLKESQFLRIKDIKAQVVGGLSVDLNEKITNKK